MKSVDGKPPQSTLNVPAEGFGVSEGHVPSTSSEQRFNQNHGINQDDTEQ